MKGSISLSELRKEMSSYGTASSTKANAVIDVHIQTHPHHLMLIYLGKMTNFPNLQNDEGILTPWTFSLTISLSLFVAGESNLPIKYFNVFLFATDYKCISPE